jgi:protein-S-isoprenylcysteine O-methyltransferase Ste14
MSLSLVDLQRGMTSTIRPALLIVWAAIVVVQAWQARRETKVLQQAFGEAYREYRRRTWW